MIHWDDDKTTEITAPGGCAFYAEVVPISDTESPQDRYAWRVCLLAPTFAPLLPFASHGTEMSVVTEHSSANHDDAIAAASLALIAMSIA